MSYIQCSNECRVPLASSPIRQQIICGGKSILREVPSLLIIGWVVATNQTLDYSPHITTPITNPLVRLQSEDTSVLFGDEAELMQFIAYLDAEMSHHPDTVIPADEEQLNRIAALVEGVLL